MNNVITGYDTFGVDVKEPGAYLPAVMDESVAFSTGQSCLPEKKIRYGQYLENSWRQFHR